MKAKLSKSKDGGYILLHDPSGWGIGSTDHEYVANHRGEQIVSKLSKQNCEEEFAKAMGVVDVEKLAEECAETAHTMDELYENGLFYGFVAGFNKAMELNKDKVFTLGQLKTAMDMARVMIDGKYAHSGEYIYNFIQQPTEIEVTFNPEEKDSEGCLILKKK